MLSLEAALRLLTKGLPTFRWSLELRWLAMVNNFRTCLAEYPDGWLWKHLRANQDGPFIGY